MKQNTHPQYFPKAILRCACGNTWTGGATMPEISVEICNNCHPFYTGTTKMIDTRGRIEKFSRRVKKAEETALSKTVKKPRVKKNIKV